MARTAQATWYRASAGSGSPARPPASAMIMARMQLMSTEADSTIEERCSPSAAPAAASRPPTKLAKLFRYNELNYGMKQITPACAAIVSGGTGTWGYKIRTEGKTELVMVEIEQKDA